jgi:hypothetical protein
MDRPIGLNRWPHGIPRRHSWWLPDNLLRTDQRVSLPALAQPFSIELFASIFSAIV